MALPSAFPFPAERDKANNIKVRADHFDANMEYLISLIQNALSRFGANKMQGNIDANQHTFNNLPTPVDAGDAANKQYVDSLIQQIISRNPQLQPALLQLATQDETLAGAVTNKAVSPATLALAISSAISASTNNLPYGFLGGFDLSFSNNTQITIGSGQCTDSTNTRNMIVNWTANKDISTLWAPSNQTSAVVGGRPSSVPLNPWTRYNIFAISTEPTPATRGTFTTSNIIANVDNFKGVSDGFIRVVVDGINYDYQNLDFSLIANLDDVAQVLKDAITGVDINVNEEALVFTSGQTGATSSVNLATVPGGVGTDLSTTSYLDAANGTAVQGQNYVYAVVDFGIDQGNNYSASNLLAADGTAYAAGFRNYRYIGYVVVGLNNVIFSVTGAVEEAEFNKARQDRQCSMRDYMNITDKGNGNFLVATNFYSLAKGYFPCYREISLGIVNGQCYAYWGTDGIRRFMLPDTKMRDWLGGYYGKRTLTDNVTGQTISCWQLPDLWNSGNYRRGCGGNASGTGTWQDSGAPNITGSIGGTTPQSGLIPNMCQYNQQVYAPCAGAFYNDSGYFNGANYLGGGSAAQYGQVNGQRFILDASRSSAVYGRSPKEIRTKNLSCFMFIAY